VPIQIKSIVIEVFQQPTEDKELILTGLKKLVPSFRDTDEIPGLSYKILFGHHKNEIILYSLTRKKKSLIDSTIAFLINNLRESLLFDSLVRKISEDGTIHIRIDKQRLIGDDKIYSIDLNSIPANKVDIYKIIIKFAYFGNKSGKYNAIKNYFKKYYND
jgi:RNA binding exosome subunit